MMPEMPPSPDVRIEKGSRLAAILDQEEMWVASRMPYHELAIQCQREAIGHSMPPAPSHNLAPMPYGPLPVQCAALQKTWTG